MSTKTCKPRHLKSYPDNTPKHPKGSIRNHEPDARQGHGIIFDLDGTLLDTLRDIADAANRVLEANGFPVHSLESYRWFVGDGSRMLMTRALPETRRTPRRIETCLRGFISEYTRNWARATRPYAGIDDLLAALAARKVPMAVVTNKPHRFTGAMMAHYFENRPFAPVLGQQDGIPKKPDPHQALAAAGIMGISPANCIFLGDSAVDMETGRRAGMQPVGAAWGFRPPEELSDAGAVAVIHHPLKLLEFIGAPPDDSRRRPTTQSICHKSAQR
jgi:phosphoglycolate phosphatase